MELPPITVLMTLYIPPTEGGFARLKGAKQTLLSWGRHMKYAGPLRVHIANDSTELAESEVEGGPDALAKFSAVEVVVSHTRGSGLGGAFNRGLGEAMAHGGLVLYADDSYSLVEDINLTPWAQVLEQYEEIGAVSLMPPRPGLRGGYCAYFHNIRTEGVAGMIFPKEGYVWNGRPLLYHPRFFEAYGLTKEGCSGYEWENTYSEHYNATPGPNVLFGFIDPWQHVWSGVRLGDKPPGWKG